MIAPVTKVRIIVISSKSLFSCILSWTLGSVDVWQSGSSVFGVLPVWVKPSFSKLLQVVMIGYPSMPKVIMGPSQQHKIIAFLFGGWKLFISFDFSKRFGFFCLHVIHWLFQNLKLLTRTAIGELNFCAKVKDFLNHIDLQGRHAICAVHVEGAFRKHENLVDLSWHIYYQ